MVDFQDVGVDYGPIVALEGVTFSVPKSSLVGIIGPNGGGKSTLLKSVVGLVKPSRGQVLVDGRSSHRMRREIGFVPQLEQVDWNFPATVWDIALMGLTPSRGLFRSHNRANREAAAHALETVGLGDLRNRGVGELSGGQRRRALLARAIAGRPRLLLLDEPMTGFDPPQQNRFLDIIDRLRDGGATVIMCTHHLASVASRASAAAAVSQRLVAYGPPEAVLQDSVLADTFGHQLVVRSAGRVFGLDRKPQWPGR